MISQRAYPSRAKTRRLLTTIRIVVRVLVDEVATGLLSSAFDLTGVHLDSFDLLANDLKLGINACSGLIQLHQDLQRANLELFPVNLNSNMEGTVRIFLA